MGRIVALLCLIPTLAWGEMLCSEYNNVMIALEKTLNMELQFYGATEEGTLIQLFTSSVSRMWAIAVTYNNGQTCVVAAGNIFEFMPSVFGEAL